MLEYWERKADKYLRKPIEKILEDLKKKCPWKMERSEIKSLKLFRGKIIEDKEENYLVEFVNEELERGIIPKERFSNLPYKINNDSQFYIAVYERKGSEVMSLAIWPSKKYWSKSLQEKCA